MCGIVGAIARNNAAPILISGLMRLEYRGYDSAGVAIIDPHSQNIERLRAQGKVSELQKALQDRPLKGQTGIAHTRWATHGVPSERNAHPHMSGEIALVHNGIIENYLELKHFLQQQGYQFTSETDTEVIVHLIDYHFRNTKELLSAVQKTIPDLKGAYALGIIHSHEPGRLIGVRCGSPLVVGLGLDENFIASDALALLHIVQQFIYLEEGDIADIRQDKVSIYDSNHHRVERSIRTSEMKADIADRGEYRHFMLKEIFEQPQAISDTLEGRIIGDFVIPATFGFQAAELFPKIKRVQIVACGTSYHAGLVGKHWLECLAGIPCQAEIASEFRYRNAVVEPDTLFVTLSQSGETADTLAALRLAKNAGYAGTLAICNVPESSLVRESDLTFMTRAGAEIGVASTKAFTTQLVALLLLTIAIGKIQKIKPEQEKKLVEELRSLSHDMEKVLKLDSHIRELSARFADKDHALFLGRGIEFPIAMEGALKLKEISYIHAEAYPAGELKHGPLALVDKNMPVIAIAPKDELLEKLKSNLQEVRARGGELFVFTDENTDLMSSADVTLIKLPPVNKTTAPIIYTLPLQLLAYHIAVLKGTDVDQPRNLAKSVTVE